jgi:predicted transglutaminase-like cysteine proteinase
MRASATPRVRRSGWVEFCAENAGECRGGATQPRDIVMSQTAWRDLVRVNKWVNETAVHHFVA